MKTAIIGAGVIGNLVAGYLKLKNKDVTLIGRPETVAAIKNRGLTISGVRGSFNISLEVSENLTETPDLAILAVKTQDVEKALKDNLNFLKNTIVLTLQNGIQSDEITSLYIPKENIISSIVMFGATYLEPAKIVHNFEGDWIIGSIYENNSSFLSETVSFLNDTFPVVISENIKSMKLLKIFLNANNCIPAILGLSIQEAFCDLTISEIAVSIWKEGLDVVKKSSVELKSLPDFSVEKIINLTSMPPNEAAKIFSGIMTNLSKEPLYGSILQSIKRGRKSEIDYINGEFVSLAEKNGLTAPLNKKLVEMVHKVEETGKFFNKEELLNPELKD